MSIEETEQSRIQQLINGKKKAGGKDDYKGFRVYALADEASGETKGPWICNVSCGKGVEKEKYTRELLAFQVDAGLIGSFEDAEIEASRKIADVGSVSATMKALLSK